MKAKPESAWQDCVRVSIESSGNKRHTHRAPLLAFAGPWRGVVSDAVLPEQFGVQGLAVVGCSGLTFRMAVRDAWRCGGIGKRAEPYGAANGQHWATLG